MSTQIGRRRPLQSRWAAASALLLATVAMLLLGAGAAYSSEPDGGEGFTQVVSLASTGMDLPRWLLLGVFVLITGVGLLLVARLVLPKRDQPRQPID